MLYEVITTYAVRPGTVYLRLAGPQRVLGKLELGIDHVYLNLKGLGLV